MKRLLVPLGLACALAACGGGGGGSAVPVANGASGPHANGQAQIRVVIPNAPGAQAAARTKPQLISAATAQLAFTIVNVDGASPAPASTPFIVTIATSTYCSSTAVGTSCSVPVPVPIAKAVVIQIATLDASGAVLDTGDVGPIDTTQSVIAQQNVTLGGVPAALVISPSSASAPLDGAPHTLTFTISAQDAAGNTIISSTPYATPITIALQGATGSALSISPTTIAAPGANGKQTVTLTYNGSPTGGLTKIVATSGSIAQTASFAPLVYSPTSFGQLDVGTPVTLTVSEAGYAGAFTASPPPFVTRSCVPSSCTPATAGGAVAITLTATGAGSGNIALADTLGSTASLALTATTVSGGGSVVGPPYPVYEYPTAAGGKNYGITVGGSGQSLWYVDAALDTIGEVLKPGACNGTVTSCPTSELAALPTIQTPPLALRTISTGSDGNLYLADPGVGTDLGSVTQATCSDTSASCSLAQQMNFGRTIATPAPFDAKLGPDGFVYATSSFSQMLPGPPPTPGPSFIYASYASGFGTSFVAPIAVAPYPSSPGYLTLDQSGTAFWFTDNGNGNIGYLPIPCGVLPCTVVEQPSNIVTFHPGAGHAPRGGPQIHPHPLGAGTAGTPFSTPLGGIVEGPDGYLYVAEPSAHRIDRLQASTWQTCSGLSCTYTPIALPDASAVPMMLAVGPDGNIWFTDANATKGEVGFIALNTCSASGCNAHEYPVPTANGIPWGIASGPDGNIWFTESGTNKIGEVKLQ